MSSEEWTQAYWKHQYGSLREHENQRLTVSNITLSLTLVVLALAFNQDDFNVVNGLALPLAIIVVNLAAIAFHQSVSNYMGVHHRRAREILAHHAPDLQDMNEAIPLPSGSLFVGRRRPLITLHLTLGLLALVPILAWALD